MAMALASLMKDYIIENNSSILDRHQPNYKNN
jgi:hypothetical protein